jgi:hypothetical protein
MLSVIIQAIDPPKSKSRPTVISNEEGRRMKTTRRYLFEVDVQDRLYSVSWLQSSRHEESARDEILLG